MSDPAVEIPNRPAFKASEVCEIAQIPPYVLKSWEKEFPNLGVAPKPGAARVYRRQDVEQVLKIKNLLFAEGLTLAGARKKLEGEPAVEDEPFLPDLTPVGDEVRQRVAKLKQEMRSLLDFLGAPRSEPAAPPSTPASSAGRKTRPWGHGEPEASATANDAPASAEASATDEPQPAKPPRRARASAVRADK